MHSFDASIGLLATPSDEKSKTGALFLSDTNVILSTKMHYTALWLNAALS